MKGKAHWFFGTGSRGCVHDSQCGPFSSRGDAVDAARECFDLNEKQAAILMAGWAVALEPTTNIVEVLMCECTTPEAHES